MAVVEDFSMIGPTNIVQMHVTSDLPPYSLESFAPERFRRADEAACQQASYRPACQRLA